MVSLISLFSFCAAGKLGYWNEGDHIHYNVVTKQKLVADVCFQVCTVPPFLPLTVALGITLSKNFHGWLLPLSSLLAYPSYPPPPDFPLSLQLVACSAVWGHKPHSPWRTITLALGFAQSGASPGVWHAVVHCCKQRHTYIESIPSSAVPDGWQTGMLPGPNHLLQLDDRVPQQGVVAVRDWDLFLCFLHSH